MYLDDDPPIAAGREIWGFPKKYAHPKLEIVKDTLTGTLEYAGQLVAMGTHGLQAREHGRQRRSHPATLSKTQINLKMIPGVDGRPKICQLVAINLIDIVPKGSWMGPAGCTWCRTSMRRSPTSRSAAVSARIITSPI